VMTSSLELPNNLILLDQTDSAELSTSLYPVLYPFALEELLCRKIGKGLAPIVHLWRHPRAFVMGFRDSRLPHAVEATRWLEGQGYQTAVRNSGGAAVPLDMGVINVSLLLPKPEGNMDHRKDFEQMACLLREALMNLTSEVQKGGVAGSFCPGDYDLSIRGKKFCGIAQRRQQHALSVQAFVIVEGKGADKALLAKGFYDRAAGDANPADYPVVLPDSMASLSECLSKPLTSGHFIQSIREVLETRGIQTDKEPEALPAEYEIREMMELMRVRYGIARNP
jgi:octanoyl-[GcvH]:protein N-octanoyltransferase